MTSKVILYGGELGALYYGYSQGFGLYGWIGVLLFTAAYYNVVMFVL